MKVYYKDEDTLRENYCQMHNCNDCDPKHEDDEGGGCCNSCDEYIVNNYESIIGEDVSQDDEFYSKKEVDKRINEYKQEIQKAGSWGMNRFNALRKLKEIFKEE